MDVFQRPIQQETKQWQFCVQGRHSAGNEVRLEY